MPLVLNAGLHGTGRAARWSVQGIELTFAVNQPAHQVIATALLPLLRAAQAAGDHRSEVHNPDSGGRVGKPGQLGDSAVWITALVLDAGWQCGVRWRQGLQGQQLCKMLARELKRRPRHHPSDGLEPGAALRAPGLFPAKPPRILLDGGLAFVPATRCG